MDICLNNNHLPDFSFYKSDIWKWNQCRITSTTKTYKYKFKQDILKYNSRQCYCLYVFVDLLRKLPVSWYFWLEAAVVDFTTLLQCSVRCIACNCLWITRHCVKVLVLVLRCKVLVLTKKSWSWSWNKSLGLGLEKKSYLHLYH